MKYKINKGFITQKIGGKVTIFAGEESTLFTLNETGAYIFQGIKLGWDKEKIISKLISIYDITEADAKKDLKLFIETLLEKNILAVK